MFLKEVGRRLRPWEHCAFKAISGRRLASVPSSTPNSTPLHICFKARLFLGAVREAYVAAPPMRFGSSKMVGNRGEMA